MLPKAPSKAQRKTLPSNKLKQSTKLLATTSRRIIKKNLTAKATCKSTKTVAAVAKTERCFKPSSILLQSLIIVLF